MITGIDNLTTSIASFNETTGVDVSILHPTVLVVLTPNEGYSIIASNFSAILPLPGDISNITFAQDGLNVNATVTFVAPFIMPQADVSIPFCVDGFVSLLLYSISGSVSASVSCNLSPYQGSYSATGEFNTNTNVLSVPIRAIPGYYFPTIPTLSLASGDINNYTLSSNKIFDISGNLIEVDFTIGYTFPSANIAGDAWDLNACAYEIYVPATGISSYSISTVGIIPEGETRIMKVFGNPGSTFTVDLDGVSVVANIVMGSSGVYSFPIVFPTVVTNTTYTIELFGDLSVPFLQQNPFTIEQRLATDVTFDVLFNGGVTGITPVVKSFTAFTAPLVGEAAFTIDIPWDIVPSPALTGNQELALSSQPIDANWSNLNDVTNGGTSLYPSANITLGNPAIAGTITVSGNIEFYGGTNMTTTLDLTGLLTIVDSPSIVTTTPFNIVDISADGGGESINDEGLTLINKGIEWSLDPNLSTILNSSTVIGSSVTNFTATMSNLVPSTTYYVRAFATNSLGIGYGVIKQFMTTVGPVTVCQNYTIGGTDTGSTTYLDCSGVSQIASYDGLAVGGSEFTSFCATQIVSVNSGSAPVQTAGVCP